MTELTDRLDADLADIRRIEADLRDAIAQIRRLTRGQVPTEPPTPTTQRLAYSPNEAAELLGISRAYIYDLINGGDLPSLKLGRKRLIRHDALTAYLDRIEHGT